MRKLTTILATLALFSVVFAASDETSTTIDVQSIDQIDVLDETVTLTLAAPATEDPANYARVEQGVANGITVSHNQQSTMKVVAEVKADGLEAKSNDITLQVSTTSEVGFLPLVTEGAADTGQDLITGIEAGIHDYGLYFAADASIAKTKVDAYTFVVTFTTVDEGGAPTEQ